MTRSTTTRSATTRTARTTTDVAAEVVFPPTAPGTGQDAETVHVRTQGGWREIRLHDYAEVFAVPGLYEKIFADTLACDSPRVVTDHLVRVVLDEHAVDESSLTALDLGAGNGMVGEELRARGIDAVVGLDRIAAAADAAHRDRPGTYRDYLVGDITQPAIARSVRQTQPNLLVCVAALGFGDIPVTAFTAAIELLPRRSWVAFNIKSEFLTDADPTGFADHLAEQMMFGQLELVDETSYTHRMARSGQPLHYTSIIARTG